MKLTRRTMPEFYEALRAVMSQFDMELIKNDGMWLERLADIDGYRIYFTPFASHKPFYRGQK